MTWSLTSLVELFQTVVVDSLLLFILVAVVIAVFFVLLNRRDLKVEDQAYRNEYQPSKALRKFAHKGETEDDRIDVRRALQPYDQRKASVHSTSGAVPAATQAVMDDSSPRPSQDFAPEDFPTEDPPPHDSDPTAPERTAQPAQTSEDLLPLDYGPPSAMPLKRSSPKSDD